MVLPPQQLPLFNYLAKGGEALPFIRAVAEGLLPERWESRLCRIIPIIIAAIPAHDSGEGEGEDRISISPNNANKTSSEWVASTAANPLMLLRTISTHNIQLFSSFMF
jgi:hypothetical protein